METLVEEHTLTANDRCDSCVAQAYYIVSLASGMLFFCRHHFLKNEDALRDIAKYVFDGTEALG